MLLWKKEYKSKYHLLLDDEVSSRTKNKVRLELGLYDQIKASDFKKIDEILDYYILIQDWNNIKKCFKYFLNKKFLSKNKKEFFLKKFYPFLPDEVEAYARKEKYYFLCSYFDSEYINYNNTQDYFFLKSNYSSNIFEKEKILNQYFSSQSLLGIYLRDRESFSVREFSCKVALNIKNRRKVSIIMTSYNNEMDIETSVLSVLGQIGVDVELIVIDDNSQDNTSNIIKKLMTNEERIKAVFLQENIGTYKAKNLGLALATGDYLAFQDADDFSHPERLSESISKLEAEKHLVAVSSRYVRLTDQGQFISSKRIPIIRWSPLTLVIRREEVLKRLIKFDEVRFGADSEFFSRLIASFGIKSHSIIDKVLMVCRDRQGSLMKKDAVFFGFSKQRNEYMKNYNERILYNLKQ